MGAPDEINEPEFQQARAEVYDTLTPLFEKRPELKDLFEVIQIPERVIQFRVVWEDDKGKLNVNTGFRVQFNSALGPYKGGLRLHSSVSLSILKFLGFEQTFKNALTGLNMGGGKGGSDFDPKGKTDNEIRRFCVAFATELSRHIGPNTDVPAGDIGFSTREAGFLFGQYKKLRNEWGGMITGKGASWGGSEIRPEATGYGLIYYVQCMIKEAEGTSDLEATFKGKTVAISGSGNVAQYAALKAMELGAKVVSLSDSKGSLIAKGDKTFTPEDVYKIQALKAKHGYLTDSGLSQFEYLDGKRPWEQFEKLDIALPCATQNEVSGEEAKALVKAGVKFIAEGSNMGSTKEAIDVFEEAREKDVWYAPGKAANCGGVAVSGLEMAQNSQRITWSPEEVDAKLKKIMIDCYQLCFDTAKQYSTAKTRLPSLTAGANISGYVKVAEAMIAHGDVWVSN